MSSITSREMTSELAIKTLEKVLKGVKKSRDKIILHSDQGSQYSSKKFIEYCEENFIQQSMSREQVVPMIMHQWKDILIH